MSRRSHEKKAISGVNNISICFIFDYLLRILKPKKKLYLYSNTERLCSLIHRKSTLKIRNRNLFNYLKTFLKYVFATIKLKLHHYSTIYLCTWYINVNNIISDREVFLIFSRSAFVVYLTTVTIYYYKTRLIRCIICNW